MDLLTLSGTGAEDHIPGVGAGGAPPVPSEAWAITGTAAASAGGTSAAAAEYRVTMGATTAGVATVGSGVSRLGSKLVHARVRGFEMPQLIALLGSIVLPTMDVISDWLVTIKWLSSGHTNWGLISLVFILVPGIYSAFNLVFPGCFELQNGVFNICVKEQSRSKHFFDVSRPAVACIVYPSYFIVGLSGLGPVLHAVLMLWEADSSRLGSNMTNLKWFKFGELCLEAIPQACLQTYVGVSYGQFDPGNEDFSIFLPFSVCISMLAAGSGFFAVEALCRNQDAGENLVSVGSIYGLSTTAWRAAQTASLVFAVALHACSYRAWAIFALLGFYAYICFGGLDAISRDKPYGWVMLAYGSAGGHLVGVISFFVLFQFKQGQDNNYGNETSVVGGPGSAQYVDCRDRTSGTYPLVCLLIFCAMVAPVSIHSCPGVGLRYFKPLPFKERLQKDLVALIDSMQLEQSVTQEHKVEVLWNDIAARSSFIADKCAVWNPIDSEAVGDFVAVGSYVRRKSHKSVAIVTKIRSYKTGYIDITWIDRADGLDELQEKAQKARAWVSELINQTDTTLATEYSEAAESLLHAGITATAKTQARSLSLHTKSESENDYFKERWHSGNYDALDVGATATQMTELPTMKIPCCRDCAREMVWLHKDDRNKNIQASRCNTCYRYTNGCDLTFAWTCEVCDAGFVCSLCRPGSCGLRQRLGLGSGNDPVLRDEFFKAYLANQELTDKQFAMLSPITKFRPQLLEPMIAAIWRWSDVVADGVLEANEIDRLASALNLKGCKISAASTEDKSSVYEFLSVVLVHERQAVIDSIVGDNRAKVVFLDNGQSDELEFSGLIAPARQELTADRFVALCRAHPERTIKWLVSTITPLLLCCST